jgi:hypothetical protein
LDASASGASLVKGPAPRIIGLGLAEDLPKHASSGAITWEKAGWQKAGLTNVPWLRAAADVRVFKKSFLEAAENADAIHFDLSSYSKAYPTPGVTKWELDSVVNTPAWLRKTTFTGGEP